MTARIAVAGGPRVVISHDGHRWGALVRHGFIAYGLKDEGRVYPRRRWTRRGIRRVAHRMLVRYRAELLSWER